LNNIFLSEVKETFLFVFRPDMIYEVTTKYIPVIYDWDSGFNGHDGIGYGLSGPYIKPRFIRNATLFSFLQTSRDLNKAYDDVFHKLNMKLKVDGDYKHIDNRNFLENEKIPIKNFKNVIDTIASFDGSGVKKVVLSSGYNKKFDINHIFIHHDNEDTLIFGNVPADSRRAILDIF
jgi:hypothetical protein